MSVTAEILKQAVLNNAELCELVCASNSTIGEFRNGLWASKHNVADYYPNFVTLDPAIDADALNQELLDFHPSRAWTVKDSFSNLDLVPLGFKELFEAEWIVGPDALNPRGQTSAKWKVVSSKEELKLWETAWHGRWEPKQTTLFKPSLLQNPDIEFIAAYAEDKIVAGLIVNKSKEVVGYSNIFVHTKTTEDYWKEAIDFIKQRYPAMPIVGYERDAELKTALNSCRNMSLTSCSSISLPSSLLSEVTLLSVIPHGTI